LAVLAGLSSFAAILLLSTPSFTKSIKTVVRNPSADSTADGLSVKSSNGPLITALVHDSTGATVFTPRSMSGGGVDSITWGGGSGSVPPLGWTFLKLRTSSGGDFDDDTSTSLAYENTALARPKCTCGCGSRRCGCIGAGKVTLGSNSHSFGQDGSGSTHVLTLRNKEEVSLTYSNVEVWLDIDNSVGQLDSLETFDSPILASSMVSQGNTTVPYKSTQVPSTITLAPGEVRQYNLETYNAGTYDLLLADAEHSCPGGAPTSVAMAEVPPQIVPLLGLEGMVALVLTLSGLATYVHVRRRRVAEETVR
jgi:hypothetical protein